MKPYIFALSALLLTSACALATQKPHTAVLTHFAVSTVATPTFTSAAVARNWGEEQEQAGHFELAAQAYLQESALYDKLHDPQAAEVERRRAYRMTTSIAIGIPTTVENTDSSELAKLEPAAGCYLGVLDTPSEGRTFDGESCADSFEQRIGRGVAVAFRYVRYGQPFPFAWAHQQALRGRAIELAMEPYDIYAVNDDDYLEGFAADMRQSGVKCFLRFGGEMNGAWAPWGKDPEAYKRAFRVVHDVMAHFAPSCAMVWAPNMVPLENVDKYYPGDDVVDWVGLSLYLVKYYDDKTTQPAWQDSPITYIDPFYAKYAARKPMCLVECGVTREAHADGKPCDDYAAARIEDLMSAIKVRYPQIKMMCWFDRNNLNGLDPDRRLNDYSLPPGSGALAAFKTAAADPYFLSKIPHDSDQLIGYRTGTGGLPDGYSGPIALSISTYCLNPTIEVSQGGQSVTIDRPFQLSLTDGNGPMTITVKDDRGRIAKSITLRSPVDTTLASVR